MESTGQCWYVDGDGTGQIEVLDQNTLELRIAAGFVKPDTQISRDGVSFGRAADIFDARLFVSSEKPLAKNSPSGSPMADTIKIKCSACGKFLRVPRKYLGRTGKCSQCGHRLEIAEEVTVESFEDVQLGSNAKPQQVHDNIDFESSEVWPSNCHTPRSQPQRTCPHCGEQILLVANICRHCHSRLDGSFMGHFRADTIGISNLVAAICGILLAVSVFLPSADLGFAKRSFISQVEVGGVLVLISGIVVAITGFFNSFFRKRLEVLYLVAGMYSGYEAWCVLSEIYQRSVKATEALEKLSSLGRSFVGNTGEASTLSPWSAVGPAMYLILICAVVLIVCWIVTCVAAAVQEYSEERDSKRA